MEEEYFLKKVSEITNVYFFNQKEIFLKKEELPKLEYEIMSPRVIGGVCGGNCWGDEANIPVEPDPEKEFVVLNEILYCLTPNISFLKYKKIEEKIRKFTSSDYEYYGNTTEYEYRYLKLKDLYDEIKDY